MAFIKGRNWCKEQTATTGTGNITLTGARAPGRTIASVVSVSDTWRYSISHPTLNEFESGLATQLTSTTFSRAPTVSSNANALVNFSAGTKNVDMVWDQTDIDEASAGGLTAITTSSALITALATNIDCVSFTIPANTLKVGSVYKLNAYAAFSHQAAAAPTITTALVVNALEVLTVAATPPSVLTTLGVNAEAIFTCRSIGASGTINSFVAAWMGGSTGAGQGGANSQDNATTTIDTTVARTIILRIRMSTAVASNTLRCNQAFVQKVN
jgi:hypothetical protein